MQRCALDCIPGIRRMVVGSAISGTTSRLTNLPASTRKYAREDMEALGLIVHEGFELSASAKILLTQAGILHQVSPPPEGEAIQ